MKKKLNLQAMIEIAFMAALAFVLDLLIPSIKPIPSVYLHFTMVPVMIVAFRRGALAGSISGLLWGLLQIATAEASMIHPLQTVLEYVFAPASIGVSGLFMKKVQADFQSGNKRSGLIFTTLAALSASFAKYIWHFFAGFIFWTKLYEMPLGAGIFFSFWTNGLSALGTGFLCAVVLGLLLNTAPRLIRQSL